MGTNKTALEDDASTYCKILHQFLLKRVFLCFYPYSLIGQEEEVNRAMPEEGERRLAWVREKQSKGRVTFEEVSIGQLWVLAQQTGHHRENCHVIYKCRGVCSKSGGRNFNSKLL